MGFMVGNDFIPHLPCLHISSNALPLLYRTYISIYPALGGNINENGKLNLRRLQIFMSALTEVELEQFKEHADDLKYMNAKTEAFDIDVAQITANENYDSDLGALISESMKVSGDPADLSPPGNPLSISPALRGRQRGGLEQRGSDADERV